MLMAAAALAIPSGAAASDELIRADGSCWTRFAPRVENGAAGEMRKSENGYTLTLSSRGKPHSYGGWRCRVDGLEGERYYRLRARVKTQGFSSRAQMHESLGAQLRWRGDYGGAVAPTYVWDGRSTTDGVYELDRVVQAPPKTRAVDLELVLQWSPTGQAEWDSISLQPAPAPEPRKVRVAAVWLRPRNSSSGTASVERFAEYVDRIAPQHRPDVILLGEMINRVGAPGAPDAQAEPIPGPITARLSEQARRHRTWIAFSIVERDGADLFNTGVLIDRTGRIAGKYRKVQLPFEEVSLGIAPGSSFPVFDTEFGRLGMLICHDASFPEAARELALQGAEMILMPIWGGPRAVGAGACDRERRVRGDLRLQLSQ